MKNSFDVGYRPTSPLTHDLVNKLAVIMGHCDLLAEHLKAGSPCAKRVDSIQEIARGMAKELNEYQCTLAQCARSAKGGVHMLNELPTAS
jgi:ATP/maltotriose-dependent transcriptional regulator MalT